MDESTESSDASVAAAAVASPPQEAAPLSGAEPYSISIGAPSGPVYAMVPLGVAGGVQSSLPLSGVSVKLETGEEFPAQINGPYLLGAVPWIATSVVFPGGGQFSAVAVGNLFGGGTFESQPVDVTVTVQDATLVLPSVPEASPAVQFQLNVAASAPTGVTNVEVSVDSGQSWLPLTERPPDPRPNDVWSALVTLYDPSTTTVPVSGLSVALSVRATPDQAAGPSPPSQMTVTAIDTTPPTVAWQTPADGAAIEVLGGSAGVVRVVVDVSDGGGYVSAGIMEQVSGGISGPLMCTVDGDSASAVIVPAVSGGDPIRCEAVVSLSGLGSHELTLYCVDNANNPSRQTRTVTLRQSGLQDTSEQSYLLDLVDFARNRLFVAELVSGAADGVRVSEAYLAEALCQGFAQILRAPAPVALAPINAVRGVVDVLCEYLAARAPAAIAHWALAEGSGLAVGDDTGGGSDGTLEASGWGPGRTGGHAAVFDGVAGYVQVGAAEQLTAISGVTVAAWIYPVGPGGANGAVIAGRETRYLVQRAFDGTIGWSLNTASPGWQWVSTGVSTPLGQWSHVAVCYDGSNVRTYLNGVLASTVAASGELPAAVALGEQVDFRIASRQAAPDSFFGGAIVDVGVYDHGLSECEVKLLAGVSPQDAVWLEDSLPQGVVAAGEDGWTWTSADPLPYSGTVCHHSPAASGAHQHYFSGLADGWPVNRHDRLYAYVYLDPADPPREVMLQWGDAGGWEHRAFWGDDVIELGTLGQPSRIRMGPLPETGRWVRLEVPAALVDLELAAVSALAFSLYDGQAWWDHSGKSSALGLLGDSGYEVAAYEAILIALGTSAEELRLARGAPDAVRQELAARLGISLSPVDELDQLLLPLSAVQQTDLEQLFGLEPTGAPTLDASPGTPALLDWQQRTLRAQWAAEDIVIAPPTDPAPPVIDPDIVTKDDLREPDGRDPAVDQRRTSAAGLRRDRVQWMSDQIDGPNGLQALRRAQPDPVSGLTALLATVLPGLDFTEIQTDRNAGEDISSELAAVQLNPEGFDRLVTLSQLAATGPLTDDEWGDACAILAQVLKLRMFNSGWRGEERAANLFIDPQVFQVAAVPAQLSAWRATWAARLQWEDCLTARTQQLAALSSTLADAVAVAERAALPQLRDAALALAAPDGADALARRLFIDLLVGPQLTTTRVDQAVEAMQGLFNAVDAGGGLMALDLNWVLRTSPESFFGELAWMGAYRRWTAAMDVFFYPENHLLPSTWPHPLATDAFLGLITDLTDPKAPLLTAQTARDHARSYWDAVPGPAPPPAGLPAYGTSAQNASMYPYTERLDDNQLTALAAAEIGMLPGTNTLSVVPAFLREVLCYVPVQLALGLAQARQWQSALDWLRIIYDRDRPAGQREIFGGFALNTTGGASTRDENWLQQGNLDAHAFAEMRAGSYLRYTLMAIAEILCDWADEEFARDTAESRAHASSLYDQALPLLVPPAFPNADQIAPNPAPEALVARATAGLGKLRAGLNIAGLSRPLAGINTPDANVAISPATDYRYATLIARAQQFVSAAAQLETNYVATLDRQDADGYTREVAQEDLSAAQTRVTVANDQAAIATQEVAVATWQMKRANTQTETYTKWIRNGPNENEQATLNDYQDAGTYRAAADRLQGVGAFFQNWMTGNYSGAVAGAFGASESAQADLASSQAQIHATEASFERRADEWRLQRSLAQIDGTIAKQQVAIANGRAQAAADEQTAATQTQTNAQARLDFLSGKFLNAQLLAWMRGVLAGAYRHQLQQAAAVARLAEQQLAFERQAPPAGYIKSDYWTAGAGAPGGSIAAGGLTGSASLLADITQLDQYAFQTNQRKLQLTQTFSLAAVAPIDLQRFRESGVLPFAVPLANYGMPGMYLATIRRVRVSVAALIPPDRGIKATLAGGGTSRIVVDGGDAFRTVRLARAPETVILTSPNNASGVFDLDPQPELMLPWEGCGLDVPFELRLPRALNAFDYRTLADVQITVDYTALYSADYAAQVSRERPSQTSNSAGFRLRDYPDAWYQLLSQAQAAAGQSLPPTGAPQLQPLIAQWSLTGDDFPVNLSGLAVENIVLMIIRTGTIPAQFGIDHLYRNGQPARPGQSTAATTVGDIVSTRNDSGKTWKSATALIGVSPVATWEAGLVGDQDTAAAIAGGDVQDLVLVISYAGNRPAWPA